MLEHVKLEVVRLGQLIGNIKPLEVSRAELMLKRGLLYPVR